MLNHRMTSFLLLSCLAVSILTEGQAAPESKEEKLAARITDMGALPGGKYSGAMSINGVGQVVGWSDTGSGRISTGVLNTRAVLWDRGKIVILADSSNGSRPFGCGLAINDAGQILIGPEARSDGYDGPLDIILPSYCLLWNKGTLTSVSLDAKSLNRSGVAVGQWQGQAATWRGGKVFPLVHRTSAPYSVAYSINDGGDTAGNDGGNATLWQAETAIHIPFPASYRGGEAIVLNNLRQVLLLGYDARGAAHPLLWQDGRTVVLKSPGMTDSVFPYGLNNKGQVVGTSQNRALLWNKGKMIDLNSLLPPQSGWTLTEARSINDRGEIVGQGTIGGLKHAFLMKTSGADLEI